MELTKMTGKSFETLTQRIIYNYMSVLPELRSIKSDIASEKSQEQMHAWLEKLYFTLYKNPSVLDLPVYPDETNDTPLPGRSYKEVTATRELIQKNIESLFNTLMEFSCAEIVNNILVVSKEANKLSYGRIKKNSELLIKAGYEFVLTKENCTLYNSEYPELMAGLKLLAQQVLNNITSSGVQYINDKLFYFSMCFYDYKYIYQFDMYKKLSYYPENVQKLYAYLENKGYTLALCGPSNRYIKGEKMIGELPVKCTIEYLPQFKNQIMFSFMSDKTVIKDCLNNFNELSDNMKAFLFSKIKQCNSCGFCNQVNRERPLMFIETSYNNKDIHFCYHFQHIRFNDMDDASLEKIMHFYDFLDERYKNYKVLGEIHK